MEVKLFFPSRWAIDQKVCARCLFFSPPFHDDLSAFGSTHRLLLVRLPFWYRAGGWLSLMNILSYLIFYLSETKTQICSFSSNTLTYNKLTDILSDHTILAQRKLTSRDTQSQRLR